MPARFGTRNDGELAGMATRYAVTVTAVVVMMFAGLAPSAHADRGFTPRFSANDAGDITIVGNTLESCPTADSQCAAARDGTNPTLANLNNNFFAAGRPMSYVDVDADATTFNSSTADLALPAGSTVLFAGLYYGADHSAGPGGAAAQDTSPAGRSAVKLRAPGDSGYATLTASVLDDSTLNPGRYQAFVNVTSRVRSAGSGTYGVADVQAGTGADHYAGWSLVIAYRDATQLPRNLTVFDGLSTIVSNAPPTSIGVNGFTTPPSGAVKSTVGFIAYEGDLGLLGDSASLLTSKGAFTLANAQNPATNYFNSSISRLGTRFTAKSPDYVNQLGYDADLLDADGFLGNGDTSATIRVTTQQDQYLPGVITFSTQLYAPVVTPSKSVANVTNPAGPNRPGDTLRYTINYANSGQDEANNFVLRDAIPANAAYTPGSLRITGGPNAPATPSDAAGDDLGEYDAANDLVRFRLGTGASATQGGQLGDGASSTNSVTVTFDVTVDANAANGEKVTNAALADFTGDTLGTPFVDQKTPPVTTTIQTPDLALSKSHSPAGAFAGGTTATFQLIARNVGSTSTDGSTVTVTDTFPGPAAGGFDAIHDAGGVGWSCAIAGLTLTCTRSDALAAGDSYPAIVVDADVHDPASASVVNTAHVAGGGDQTPGNNTATDTGPGNAQADVSLTKSASPRSVATGDTVTFTLVARNNGPSTAASVQVSDALPAGTYANVVATPTQGTCTAAVVCDLGSIARNRSVTISISATVLVNDTALSNTATASSPTPDPVPTNNSDTATVTVPNSADLAITKTGSPQNPQVGAAFTYTLLVRNLGPGDASGLAVTDDLPDALAAPVVSAPAGWTCNAPATGGTVRCSSAALANGASSAITISGTIAPAAGGRFFTNGASVASSSHDPNSSNNTDSTTITASPAADLSLTKQFHTNAAATASDPVNAGDQVTFDLVLTNNGPSDATGVTITDPLPAGLTFVSSNTGACTSAAGRLHCAVGALANGATFSARITADVAAAGTATGILNQATATGDQGDPVPSNNAGQDTLTVNPSADVAIRKTAPTTAAVGDTVAYTLDVSNHGPSTAVNVRVSDALPAGTTLVSTVAPAGATCASPAGGGTGTISCTFSSLASGAGATISVSVRIGASLAGTTFANTAAVASDTFDPGLLNNDDQAAVTVDPQADLQVVKTASVANPRVGEDVTYTLAVSNHGPSDATGVVVTDTLPAGVDFIRADAGCLAGVSVVTCAIGPVAAGQTVQRQITVQTTFGNAGAPARNSATVSGNEVDPDPTNNTSAVDVDVQQQIDLRLTKTVSDATPAANSDFEYTLSVFNNGPSPATAVVIADPLPTGVDYVSGPGDCTVGLRTVSCAIGTVAAKARIARTITVHATPAAAGAALTNGATVAGAEPEVNPSNNQATADVTVGPLVDLAITKTASDPTPASGARLAYVLTVANAGPSAATNVVVGDLVPAGLTLVSATPSQGTCAGATCALGTIAAGGAAQVELVTTVIAPGGTPVANTATVTSDEPDATPADNTATTTVDVIAAPPGPVAAPLLHIDKLVDKAAAKVGDKLHYRIVVDNRGDAAATGVRVTDTFTGSADVRSVSASAGTCTQRQPVTCALGTIAAKHSVTIKLTARATARGRLRNTATMQAAGDPAVIGGDQDVAGTDVSGGAAALRVTKRAGRRRVASGSLVGYRITVRNLGPVTALGVRVCDRVPRGESFYSAPGARFRGGRACWKVGSLRTGRTQTFTIRVRAQNAPRARTVRNVAGARATNAARRSAGARVRMLPAAVRPGGVTG